MTAEQLLHLGDIGPCELIPGRRVMLDMAGAAAGEATTALMVAMAHHVEATNLGQIVPGVGFVIEYNPDTVRAPDIAFIPDGRLPLPDPEDYVEGSPGLAVEVVSFNETEQYLAEKTDSWLKAGCRAVWGVDPRTRTVPSIIPTAGPR